MKITGIDCQIPSNKINNEEIVELVKFYSDSKFLGDINELESMVRRLLNTTGLNTRFWRTKHEKPMDLIRVAVERVLKMANIQKNKVDLIIYSSIDRGFIEPANASFICKTLEFNNIRCFDIVDACMGWCTALQTAQAFLKSSSSINTILLINAEFPMDNPGSILPNNFTINEIKELQWKFPSLTLGEGTSACVIVNDSSSCQFEFIESPQYADLCTIPLINSEKLFKNELNTKTPLTFYASSTELLNAGLDSSVDVLNRLLGKIDYVPKMIFPHSISNKIIYDAASKARISSLIYSTFQELGNLATVSIPSSICKAILKKEISSGDKTIGWIASAGMKFSAFEIQL